MLFFNIYNTIQAAKMMQLQNKYGDMSSSSAESSSSLTSTSSNRREEETTQYLTALADFDDYEQIGPLLEGKRRRSNVAVIIDRIIFISSFLFYCLLYNHSFQTNPNRMTNCFQLFLFIQLDYIQKIKTNVVKWVNVRQKRWTLQ